MTNWVGGGGGYNVTLLTYKRPLFLKAFSVAYRVESYSTYNDGLFLLVSDVAEVPRVTLCILIDR